MSELERVGRLPVFIDEEQWSRAFDAAKREMRVLYHATDATIPSAADLDSLATRIATAALRAAAQEDVGDVAELPGVTVSHIDETPSHTDTVHPPHRHRLPRKIYEEAGLPVPPD